MDNIPEGFKDNGEPEILNISGNSNSYYRFRAWKDKQEEQERLEYEERQTGLSLEDSKDWQKVNKFKEQNEQ